MSLMTVKGNRWPPKAWILATYNDPDIKWNINPYKIVENSSTIGLITTIQNKVNESVIYQEDEPGEDIWGKFSLRKIWSLDGGTREVKSGDCDDYALEKYRILIKTKFGGCSRVVVCTRKSKGHLVVCVDLGENTYVLCNTLDGVWKWDDIKFQNYRFLYCSVPGQFMWSNI